MNAQYYYIDPESQKTRGPFSLEAIQALHQQDALDRATLVCRVVAEEWERLRYLPGVAAAPG